MKTTSCVPVAFPPKLPYTESAAKQADLHIQQGYDLMEYVLCGNR